MARKTPAARNAISKEQQALALIGTQLRRHSTVTDKEANALQALSPEIKNFSKGEDIVRQGDKPVSSVFILSGMLGRYHTTGSGSRQYLSLHITGDFPDLQSLFLVEMDHGLAALDEVEVACLPHKQLRKAMLDSPALTFAFWRETLIDAAIFRQAITNNGSRSSVERLAHLLCEQYVRAREAEINVGTSTGFPLNQTQIGQTLGMSIVTVNRALQQLRRKKCIDLREGKLFILDWKKLQREGNFDSAYLHTALHAGPFHVD